jgi:lipase chaperone LimK
MITDTEIRLKGLKILAKYLGDVEAERFVALIQREPFDYTKWRQGADEDLSIEEISKKAMALRMKDAEHQKDRVDT